MKKRILCAVLTLVLLAAMLLPSLAPTAQAAGSTAVSDARKGVVRVYSEFPNSTEINLGSAFGVGAAGEETDIFITNYHVVSTPQTFKEKKSNEKVEMDVMARRVYLAVDPNPFNGDVYTYRYKGEIKHTSVTVDADPARLVPCDVIWYSVEHDLAILKATKKVEGRVALDLAPDAEDVAPGGTVYALGFPSMVDAISDSEAMYTGDHKTVKGYWCEIYVHGRTFGSDVDDVTVTTGTVSRFTSINDRNDVDVVQHDAEIHNGNSGGPLINEKGQVIGINSYGQGAASLNYAIYVDYIREALKDEGIDIKPPKANTNKTDSGTSNNSGNTPAPTTPAPTKPAPTTPEPTTPTPSPNYVLIVGIAAGVLALAAIAVLLLRKKTPPVQPAAQQPPVQKKAPLNPGSLRFQGINGVYAGKRYSINGTVRFGRNPQNDIVYPANTKGISGAHCSLTNVNGRLYLQDLGSTYGTFVAGKKLAPNQMVEVRLGDRFSLGSDQETFAIVPQGGM